MTRIKSEESKPYHTKLKGEELQNYLRFRSRGGKVPPKKGKGSFKRRKNPSLED